MNKVKERINTWLLEGKNKRAKSKANEGPKDYFRRARSWADDTFGALEQSRNRYQVAFFSSMGLNVLAISAVFALAHVQTLVPMMVHHFDNGVVSVEPLTQEKAPMNKSQIESDLVRYIQHRESYDVSAYRTQYDLVNLLSTDAVAKAYMSEQDRSEASSPINTLGVEGKREVHVYNINFLDNVSFNEKALNKDHHNVAEVVFTLTDMDKNSTRKSVHHYSTLVSWEYVKPSTNPAERWQNWDGFLVTNYTKQVRNV
jgi:type IV secretion system protein VirB8